MSDREREEEDRQLAAEAAHREAESSGDSRWHLRQALRKKSSTASVHPSKQFAGIFPSTSVCMPRLEAISDLALYPLTWRHLAAWGRTHSASAKGALGKSNHARISGRNAAASGGAIFLSPVPEYQVMESGVETHK